jgi:hypothetical protein
LYVTFLIISRIERSMIKNVYWGSCNVSVILVRFLMKLEFPRHILKNIGISDFKEIRVCLFHADRQTKRSERSLFAVLRTRLLSVLDNNI